MRNKIKILGLLGVIASIFMLLLVFIFHDYFTLLFIIGLERYKMSNIDNTTTLRYFWYDFNIFTTHIRIEKEPTLHVAKVWDHNTVFVSVPSDTSPYGYNCYIYEGPTKNLRINYGDNTAWFVTNNQITVDASTGYWNFPTLNTNADPTSFELVKCKNNSYNFCWAKDSNHVYFLYWWDDPETGIDYNYIDVIDDIQPASFKVIENTRYAYAKTDNNTIKIFYIENKDPVSEIGIDYDILTFNNLLNHEKSFDYIAFCDFTDYSNCKIFYKDKELTEADYKSLTVVSSNYALSYDNKNIYCLNRSIKLPYEATLDDITFKFSVEKEEGINKYYVKFCNASTNTCSSKYRVYCDHTQHCLDSISTYR